MSRELRYEVREEPAGKWLAEEMLEDATGLDTDEGVRVIIIDHESERRVDAVGDDHDEALERACKKMGIDESDLDEELDD